ncbi:lytic murein transglycosylase [Nocardioides sp.]|uniref:lytic murein transglycosylase n=1 Tax=Nocardioides sp. TaxID=35761 RepID=UPI00321A0AFC
MTARPLRAAVAFTVALVALSGLAYLLQQTLYARPTTMDLTPAAAGQPGQPPSAVPAAPAVPSVPSGSEAASGGESDVPVIDETWLQQTSTASGVPVTALRAYARAELMAPGGCGIGWTTLAGIGWVESQHGLIGGRVLLLDGRSSEPILGPALNGVGNVMAIPATRESRRWHGDKVWDHAFGPMQFISSTWVAWQSDGDGDGVSDPNDLDDAAYAAARYLCAGERDLASAAGWTAGILSYNNARSYLDAVHVAATAYADRTR